MALQSDVNNVNSAADGGGDTLYRLKEVLVAAGWAVIASGGGTGSGLYSAVGDVIASAAIMNTSRAWFRIQAPAAMSPRREFCCQRGSGGERNVWIKVSAEDGFSGGAPDEDDMPTATDQQSLFGSTTAGTTLWGVGGTYRMHIVADDATPFAWYCATLITGTGVQSGALYFEPLESGSYPSVAPNDDEDPAVYFAGASTPWSNQAQPTLCAFGWYDKDGGAEAWARMPAYRMVDSIGNVLLPGGMGTNPYSGRDSGERMMYARAATLGTQIGRKGYSSTIRWNAVARANGDTQSDPATGDIERIVIGDCTLPYPNVVPLI